MHSAPDGELRISVFPRHDAVHILDVDAGFFAQDAAQAGRVESRSRSDHHPLRQSAFPGHDVSVDVHRIRNHQEHPAVVMLHDVPGDFLDDVDVLLRQVEPRFTVFSAESRRDDDDVGVLHFLVTAAPHVHRAEERQPVTDVKRLPLGFLRKNVDDRKLGNHVLHGDRIGDGSSDVSCSDHRDFPATLAHFPVLLPDKINRSSDFERRMRNPSAAMALQI
ncbi:hypothetical protein SDC9_143412 [bioreactor metagenome]|uniref:Uncharacterized protein n=1 Tax=bioreactor metagenome TaxID=1076179 RepID=A0A645E381_9ZZZZ